MKHILGAVAFCLVGSGAALADPIYGLWKTEPSDGIFYHVQMGACGPAVGGGFQKKFENGVQVDSDVIGKNAVFDMKPTGDGEYKGKAWRPSNDRVYNGAGTLSGNSLKIGGCVLGGIICLKQNWTRVN